MFDHKKKKILLADDSSSALMYLSLVLKRMGFHVIAMKNGSDIFKHLVAVVPDLILLDVKTADMDGTTVLRHLKSSDQTASVPVVMTSNVTDEQVIKECESLGSAGYLIKPIHVSNLYKTIENCITFSSERKNRRHMRVPFNKKIRVQFIGISHELYAESIAEGGIYIMKKEPFPPGSELALTLPISDGEPLAVNGIVVYVKGIFGKESRVPAGMAVEFTDRSPAITEKLEKFVKNSIAGDAIDDQDESILE
jgi:CheY-like chemotaxis protein